MAGVEDIRGVTDEASPLLSAALRYAGCGWSVLPLHGAVNGQCTCANPECEPAGKHPRTAHGVKDASTDEATIRSWWARWPEASIGIATGAKSGFVVVDVDAGNGGTLEALEDGHGPLPATPRAHTGGGGYHLLFAHPGFEIRNRVGLLPGIDVRSDGGFIVAAPSGHVSGGYYRWNDDLHPDRIPLAPLPMWLCERLKPSTRKPAQITVPVSDERERRWAETALEEEVREVAAAPEGKRNDTLNVASFDLGQIVAYGALARGRVERELLRAAEQCGLTANEAQRTIASGLDAGLERPRGPADATASGHMSNGAKPAADATEKPSDRRAPGSQADRLVWLVTDAELFVSVEGETFASLARADHVETLALKSSAFRHWLMARYFETFHGAPSTQAVQTAFGVIDGRARASGIAHRVWTRVAGAGGAIYLDLGRPGWESIEVTPSGWSMTGTPPVKFRRPPHLRPLPVPERGGELAELLRLIPANAEDARLMVTWLLAAFRPVGPYPILTLYGEQGSAKSTTARLLRAIVDPAAAALRAEPREARDLIIGAVNGWVLAIDNISHLSPWLSDGLCRLATGGGFAARALYTDDGEKVFEAMRPLLLNGIEEVSDRGDLLDRTIMVYLPVILETRRRTEADLWGELDRVLPRVLGAILDAVSQGLARLPSVKLLRKPRMADFAVWGAAVAPAVGWTEADFLAAYSRNREAAHDLALEASPLALALLEIMGNEPLTWETTAAEMLAELNRKVPEKVQKSKTWPRTPRALTNALRRIAPNLRNAGVEVTFAQRTGHRRPILIESVRDAASAPSPPSPPSQAEVATA